MPVGDTGTIPFSMRNEQPDFSGAICDSKKGAGAGKTASWWEVPKRFAGITILEGYNANISIVAALLQKKKL
jgi:hypothetical protein